MLTTCDDRTVCLRCRLVLDLGTQMIKTILIYPAILVPFLTFSVPAQTSSPNWENVRAITRTTEVRILTDNTTPIRGSLERTTDTALIMSTNAQSIGRPQIVSVSVRKKGRRMRNTFIGIGVGLAAGLGIGFATASRCQGEICGIAAAGGVAAGGALGIVVGGVAGVAWPTGGWREVYRR
jgi:hypothetical protein